MPLPFFKDRRSAPKLAQRAPPAPPPNPKADLPIAAEPHVQQLFTRITEACGQEKAAWNELAQYLAQRDE